MRMLSVRGLSAGYAEKVAFENLYLDFLEGQTSVLLGPGNSGKSTLMNILTGRHSGWCQGNIYQPWPVPTFVPQEMNKSETQSLRQLILKLNPRIRNPERQIRLQWKEYPQIYILLEAGMDQPLGSLTESVQRLARVTLTLIQKNELTLLDEPDVGMGYEHLDALIATLNRFKQGRTLILVTHHLGLARSVGDFIVLMAYGRVIESKPCQFFFTEPTHPYTQSVIRMGC